MKGTGDLSDAVFAALAEGVVVQDCDGRITACNQSAERILGLTAGQMSGRTPVDPRWRSVHEDGTAFPGHEHPSTVTLRTGEPCTGVVMGVYKPSGQLTWISINSRPVHLDGRRAGVVTTFSDITVRKNSELLLRAQLSSFLVAFENANDAVILTDATGRVVEFNPASVAVFRFRDRREFLQMANRESVVMEVFQENGEPLPPERWAIPSALSGESTINALYLLRRCDTGERWLTCCSYGPIRDANGNISGAIVIGRDVTAQKMAERELRESEERWKHALEAAGDGVWDWDLETGTSTHSPAWRRLFGFRDEDLDGTIASCKSLAHPDDAPAVFEAIDAHLRGDTESVVCQHRLRCSDGTYKWVLNRAKVMRRDAEGKPARLIGTVTDISWFKQLERERASRQELLQSIFDHIPAMLSLFDSNGRIEMLNRASVQTMGWTIEQAREEGFFTQAYPDPAEREAALRHMSECSANWRAFHVRAADGRMLEVAWANVALSDGRRIGIGRDITEQNRAERALRESEERWKFALEGAGDGMWDWNIATGEVYFTTQWKALLGYSDEDIPNRIEEWESRIHPADHDAVHAQLGRHLRGETPSYVCELRLRCKDGSYRWVLDRGKVMKRDATGRAVRMIGVHSDISERKRMEEERVNRQELLESIFSHIPVMLMLSDANGEFEMLNRATLATLGWSLEEARQPGFLERCYPDPAVRAQVVRHVLDGAGTWRDFPVRTADGRTVETTWANVALSDGRTIGIGQDITERKRFERELQESRKRLEDITFSIGDWVWEVDANGRYTYTSSKGIELFGDVVGRSPFDLMTPEDAARIAPIFAGIVSRKERIRDLENWNITASGERICLLTNGVPVFDDAGNLTGYRGVDKDITARKRTEEELVRLGTAIEQAVETIVVTDAAGNIVYANPAFERTSGYSVAEVLGRNPRILKSGRQDGAFYREMWGVLAQGGTWRGHIWNRNKNGTLYLEEGSISAVRDAAGRVVNYIALKLDVTLETELKEQLIQSQKMESVGRLAGGVAHDFNNLLTIINGYCAMALDGIREGDPLRGRLTEIMLAGQRATSLTRQLLAFSRKQVLQPRVFNLNDIVMQMRSMLQRLVGEDVTLELRLSAERPVVNADPHQLEQVIMNLTVNARDAMPRGGLLLIETRLEPGSGDQGPTACLSVTDTGLGMDEATRLRAFEPFFTTKDVGRGTGLGLSMVQGIVTQSGGRIEVESTPGKGSAFHIYLPTATGDATSPKTPALPPATTQAGNILIVEDQVEVLHYTSAVLRAHGYEVTTASTPGDALLIAESQGTQFDLLLTDVVMPHMDGLELAGRLRKTIPGLKALFMSGYSDEIIARHGVLDAGSAFIQKPFSPRDLANKVRETLHTPPSPGA